MPVEVRGEDEVMHAEILETGGLIRTSSSRVAELPPRITVVEVTALGRRMLEAFPPLDGKGEADIAVDQTLDPMSQSARLKLRATLVNFAARAAIHQARSLREAAQAMLDKLKER